MGAARAEARTVVFPETPAGGFTRLDGTMQFYLRVNALLHPGMRVVDFGAGRGAFGDYETFQTAFSTLKGKVSEVIGLDVDRAVTQNKLVDRAIVYDGNHIPIEDNSVDFILSDMTFEHLTNPEITARELSRILKPGGWICARTPHLYSLIALGSSIIPNKLHTRALKKIQPERQAHDVFPAVYRLNSKNAVRRYFPIRQWEDYSYTWSPEPSYHFNIPLIMRAMRMINYVKDPLLGGETLLIFLKKLKTA